MISTIIALMLTGSPEVIFEGGAPIRSAIVAHQGTIYFGDEECILHAVDGDSGDKLWSYTTDDAPQSRPVIADGRIVFNAANTLYVLDASSGEQIHKTTFPCADTLRVSDDPWAWNDSGVAVRGDNAWFAALNGDIVEVDLTDGGIVRSHPAVNHGAVACGVEHLDGHLLWVDGGGELVCLDTATRKELYRTPLGDRIFAPMCFDEDKIYLGGRNLKMNCVDARTGEILWSSFSTDPTTWFSGGSVVVDDVLWSCTSDEHIILGLDKNTGDFRGALPVHTNAYTRPLLHGENIIVAATDVYSFDRADISEFNTRRGEVVWHVTLEESVLSTPVVVDNTLWVATDSGRIYRFGLD